MGNWILNISLTFGLMIILLIDYKKDQTEMEWRKFLPMGIGLIVILGICFLNGSAFWDWVLQSFLNNSHIWNLNALFNSIPFNDGAIFRLYQPEALTIFMRWIYHYGFVLSWAAAVTRSFFTKNVGKMVRYTLSSHLLQLPIITPFYVMFLLQEVWYVKGHPDGMARGLTGDDLLTTVQNCFPSMHTSVSFAILLLALREKGPIFKWTMVSYCTLVIFSTLYLEIHWIIDLLGGLLLGYGTVKLVDWLFVLYAKRKRSRSNVKTKAVLSERS
ncbi:phosphatase PAP2 family protein [Priestia koreensis]|uniref:phosphatase PAP2 family protein n=1 Tax=Priestia koreensis TaxID=284581 RepID=UPI00203AD002|nr:phosphatase PAP2 family protein [Priestia koreensis]MCM3004063.1 phosphatase PAP2 family protein [Priestia koreensis]